MGVTALEIPLNEILPTVRRTLGLSEATGVDDILLAAMLRRAAGFMCPCSRASLIRSITDSLEYINADENLRERIETVVDGLVSVGDLLEMSNVTTGDPDAKSTWVFLAPPAYIVRPNGKAFLCGLTPDEALPLPTSYLSRVVYSGYARSIVPQADENIAADLKGFGLIAHSERAWLRPPKLHSAQEVLTEYRQRLSLLPPSGTVEELEIIDTSKPNNYYRGRWTTPRNHNGLFIARREREYGAAIWGLAVLEDGRLEKFLDLPVKSYKWRGRDAAWHLLLALDYEAGSPQKYRRRPGPDGSTILDFFSPIPVWAQRRLAVFGEPVAKEKSLFSFKIPVDELAAEEKFLKEYLWLSPVEK